MEPHQYLFTEPVNLPEWFLDYYLGTPDLIELCHGHIDKELAEKLSLAYGGYARHCAQIHYYGSGSASHAQPNAYFPAGFSWETLGNYPDNYNSVDAWNYKKGGEQNYDVRVTQLRRLGIYKQHRDNQKIRYKKQTIVEKEEVRVTTEDPMIEILAKERAKLKNESIENIQKFLKINNTFDDKDHLAQVGSFGIQFTRLGQLFSFPEDYLLVFKIELPLDKLDIPSDYNEGSCYKFLNQMPTISLSGNESEDRKIIHALNRTCDTLENTMKNTTLQIKETASRAVKEFHLRTLTRTKRFDPVTATVAAGVVIGAFALWTVTNIQNAKHERKELFRRVEELERNFNKLSEGVERLTESFIGFQERTLDAFRHFDEKIDVLRDFTIN